MRAADLVRGVPGHPTHPPLTDVAIGAYTVATVLGALGAAGVAEESLGKAWWLTLLVGLGAGALASLTGLLDWRTIGPGSPLHRTATLHMIVMLGATGLFALAAGLGHSGYASGDVPGGPLALTIAGFVFLTVGGWIGGSIVFVHGMRVLEGPELPVHTPIAPEYEPPREHEPGHGEREPARR